MPWTCIRCESVNVDSDDTCEVCDERRGLNLPQQRQSIAAGDEHSLAITKTGSVIGWGRNEHGQTNIPDYLEEVVAVSAGSFHSLALRANGKIVEWGLISWELNLPYHLNNNVVAISAGAVHSLALRADGTVFAWGDNDEGQCDVPAMLNSVIAISAGERHSLALRSDGTVVAWGDNQYGQCNIPSHLKHVKTISAGLIFSGALTNTGKLVLWGISSKSTDTPNITDIATKSFYMIAITQEKKVLATGTDVPTVPKGLHDVVEIAAGGSHCLARQSDGTVIAWGNNNQKQCTVPIILSHTSPFRSSIAAGGEHSLAITEEGTVIGWGDNHYAQISIPDNLHEVIAVAAGDAHSVALTKHGKVVQWGFLMSDVNLPEYQNSDVIAIVAGNEHSVALRAGGTVFAWGNNDYGQCDVPATLNSVTAIAAGDHHSLALHVDGTVTAWGENDYGQCNVPKNLTNVVAIAAGLGYSHALTKAGNLVTWGIRNAFVDTPTISTIAAKEFQTLALTKDGKVVTVRGIVEYELDNVVEINVGTSHNLARKADGSIFAWGNNEYQQCNVPYEFHGFSLIKSIACTSTQSIAVTNLGQVVAGHTTLLACDNLNGVQQVAIGATYALTLCSNEMVYAWKHSSDKKILQHFPIPHVVAIAAGGEQYYALTAKGLVISITFHASKPHTIKQVPHLQHIRAIAVSNRHTLALKSDGTVVAWGDNSNNQCDVPAKLDAVVAIAAGDSHSLALKADGTVVAWGNNMLDQCQIPKNLRHVTAIAAGDGFSVALKADGSVQLFGWSPEVPKELRYITALAASGKRVMFLRDDGTMEICNRNTGASLGDLLNF